MVGLSHMARSSMETIYEFSKLKSKNFNSKRTTVR